MSPEPTIEADELERPSVEEIRTKWHVIFSDPLISLGRLKSDALSKDGLGQTVGSDGGVVLRSLYWRFYHSLLPPPTSLDLFPPALSASREAYNALRRRYLIAPDGRWASDCTGGEGITSPPSSSTSNTFPSTPTLASASASTPDAGTCAGKTPGEGWDPLSLSTSSPWTTWFKHVELRSTIFQDVERTFPDMPYFQLPNVRKCLTTSLFLFSVLNPDVGYRQGMHELLACCFIAVDRDSIDSNDAGSSNGHRNAVKGISRNGDRAESIEEIMPITLDRDYVEHDAFALFQAIMKGAKPFYEWRAEEGPLRSRGPSAPQAPIITRCNSIHSSLVRRIDPQLWERLETEGVEAQIWAIRWIRLLFTRELPFPLAMRIWDGAFAEDPGLGLLDFICMAMLLLIRNELLEADYPTLLTHLLHYPAPSPTYPFEPFLIISQALFLRNNISPAAGVEVVLQNQDLLGVRASPPERTAEDRPQPSFRGRGGMGIRGSGGRGRGGRAGVGGLAQGLFERAQAAGLDKAFMSTVADLRKNLPDSVTAYSYLPNLPFSPSGTPGRESASPFSSIPNNASALPSRTYAHGPNAPHTRPPIQSRQSIDSAASVQSLKDAELEMAELRLAMVGMGKAMSEWLDLLRPNSPSARQDGSSTAEASGSAADDDGKKAHAWTGLTKIKDSLLDAAGKETEEIVREWGWHDGLETPSSSAFLTNTAGTPDTASAFTTTGIPQHPSTGHGTFPAMVLRPGDVDPAASQDTAQTGRGELEFEDSTPTPLNVSVFPSIPHLPAVPHLSSIPQPQSQSQSRPSSHPPVQQRSQPQTSSPMTSGSAVESPSIPKHEIGSGSGSVSGGTSRLTPTLSLSSRMGTPTTGLPRTPLTAPPPPSNSRSSSTAALNKDIPHTAIGQGGSSNGSATDGRLTGFGGEGGSGNWTGVKSGQSGGGDPLAGLGVGNVQSQFGLRANVSPSVGGSRRPFSAFSSSMNTKGDLGGGQRQGLNGNVDPLLGVGLK